MEMIVVIDTCVLIKWDVKLFKKIAEYMVVPTICKSELARGKYKDIIDKLLSEVPSLRQLTPDGRLEPFGKKESSNYYSDPGDRITLKGHDEGILNSCMLYLKSKQGKVHMRLVTDDVNMRLKARCFDVDPSSSRPLLHIITRH